MSTNSYRFPDNGFNGYIEVKKRNLVNKTLEQNKNVNIEFYLPN